MTRKAVITEDDKKEIVRLHKEEGMSVVNIAKKYGCDKRRIKPILEEAGVVLTGNVKIFTDEEISNLINDYSSGELDLNGLVTKYGCRREKIKKILEEHNVTLKKQGWQNNYPERVVASYSVVKFKPVDGKHYIAKCKTTDYVSNDYLNKSGALTEYIKNALGIEVPPAHQRRRYYELNGNYWFEQYFDILLEDDKEVEVKCPYCDFTIPKGVKNINTPFFNHMKRTHKIDRDTYLRIFPEEIERFKYANETFNLKYEEDSSKYVECPICGKRMTFISESHLATHNITKDEFIDKYGDGYFIKDLRKHVHNLNEAEVKELIEDYTEYNFGLHQLTQKYHISDTKAKDILTKNGIELREKGGYDEKYENVKFKEVEGKHYVAKCKLTDYATLDYLNKGGFISSYIEDELEIPIPSLLEQREYFKANNEYWWEQYFDVVLEDDPKVIKKCPYCDFEVTEDVEYPAKSFFIHLSTIHGIDRDDYMKEHPEDVEIFKFANKTLNLQYETDENKFVVCKVCGKKLSHISHSHLAKHGLTRLEYEERYNGKVLSKEYREYIQNRMVEMNVILAEKHPIVSKDEMEIFDYINDTLGINAIKTRTILKDAKELDIYLPDKKVAIEYNGCRWHTEWFGHKGRTEHLNKTLQCEEKGIQLIHIFEDEYKYKKDIVLSKLKHILNVGEYEKIPGRKCEVRKISSIEACNFLEKNHIQGGAMSTVYLGAFYNGNLVAVMTFKVLEDESGRYELNRFASDLNYICQGIGGKLFKYFLRNYNPSYVVSFADRRWSIHKEGNLYMKLGFSFDGYTEPSYTYHNQRVDKYKRFHKSNFRKETLSRKYNLPMELTETEMVKYLGYDRIWDCGLIRYVWRRKEEEK